MHHADYSKHMEPGLLDVIKYNQARMQTDVAITAQGRILLKTGAQDWPTAIEYLGGAITGHVAAKNWHLPARSVAFFYVMRIELHLLEDYSLAAPVHFAEPQAERALHPGQAAAILVGTQRVGFLGRLHPALAQAQHHSATFVLALALAALFAAPRQECIAQPAPCFPAEPRDIALLLAELVLNAVQLQIFQQHGGAYLMHVLLLAVYAGSHMAPGQCSLA